MKGIDLFCGAGGFGSGFEQFGMDVLYGIDVNEMALETFDRNHEGESIQHDISEGVPEKLRGIDVNVVFGSPPCQGFSDARGSRRLDDERNQLVFSFIQWVGELQPEYVMMENVAGMTTIGEEFLDAVEREYRDVGYEVEWAKLNAANFGVPQTRERVIYFGVREDSPITPTLPNGDYTENGDGQLSLSGREMNGWRTVEQAFEDLPEPTDEGTIELPPLSEYPDNDYLRDIRNGGRRTYNHIAETPADNADTRAIIENLRPGEMYRSSRFGDRYRQVWDLLSDRFTETEQDCLHFIARHRTRSAFKMGDKGVGAVPDSKIAHGLEHDDDTVYTALQDLLADGWVRTDEDGDTLGYDLNTKSGIRPRYMRLNPDGQSNTILTTDFKPRDKLHPTENRGLSLREGARIQSFPDEFEFVGSFGDIANQIGNAVPPLMAKALAEHIQTVDEEINQRAVQK
ncbi:DNA cytosine methyltransferase [Haladaptatus cibarius]|uniref:DNA cytosine methyltransferase n=1 Tax=Haladaptatus cibarius TaxID=453847 RepID=UPI0006789FAB|nr:DNA cytosine methyltransferase [Haladaptatus cibarius]